MSMSYASSGLVGNMYECEYVTERYLQVNNCGILRMNGEREVITKRESRKDYKLVYMWDGEMVFRGGETSVTLHSGHLLFNRPGDPIQYQHHYGITSSHYWLHFTGGEAENLLQQCGFRDDTPQDIGQSREVCDLLYKIIHEIQTVRPGSDILCNGYFLELMGTVRRLVAPQGEGAQAPDDSKIQPALREITNFYYENRPMSYYAELCNLSLSRFTYLFSTNMHITPQVYITAMRIEQAKHLLSSAMSVEEIAHTVGYGDPLYFSRVFRKVTGVSPSIYRKGSHGETP